MRILYYFLDIDTLMYQWQRYHIVDELKRHDCEIEIFNPLAYNCVDEANEAVLSLMKNEKYDLFMTCLNESYLYVETLKYIKQLGVPTLLFCPDNLVVPFNHKKVARYFDLVWLTSKETEYLFKRWGCTTIFLPYAANPYFLTSSFDVKEINRIGFVGTPHGSRIDRINYLLSNQIPVSIHTKTSNLDNVLINAPLKAYAQKFVTYLRFPIGWKLAKACIIDKLLHRDIYDEYGCLEKNEAVPLPELAKVNSQYALVLAFSEADSTGVLKTPVPIVNLRNFEIPMSGGVQFTTYSDELASYFEDEKEIILCKTKEEYIEKAKFYLKDDQYNMRQSIRKAARNRAENEHTWFNRFRIIFDELALYSYKV